MTKKNPDFNFLASSLADWQDAARQELGETEPMEKLSHNKGSIKVKPYYDGSTNAQLGDFQQLPAINPYYGARSWMNSPRIQVNDEKEANELALTYLQSGADGILFEPVKANLRFDVLLDQIKPEFCTISFLIHSEHAKNAKDFKSWVAKSNDYNTLAGCLFWEDLSEITFKELKFNSKNFFPFGLSIPSHENAEDEIVFGLVKAAHFLESISDQHDVEHTLNQFSFSLSIGNDLFLEIAKLKALRNLWYQIQGANGVKEMKPLHIHARSTAWTTEAFQPHGNMIKSTLAALSSIAGGCDSLTIEPEGTDQTENRIARNVSSVLREESYLSNVADPTAGSYYLDSLIAALSEKAWQKFQTNMKG